MTQPTYPYPYPSAPPVLRCLQCGTELSPALLSCPRCHRLVHSERLNQLAAEAKAAEVSGDASTALARWREALELLPRESRQHATIFAQVQHLSRQVDGLGLGAGTAPRGRNQQGAALGKAAGIGGVLLFLLTKGKLLLLGLANFKTLFSMIPFLAVYWAAYGWKFALGLMLSIYVHEMGHVAMLIRYGMKASAPMFIPGLGAVIMLKQHPADPREDARIGLAGPMWGFGAAAVALVVSLLTKWPSWGAIAHVGAWLNLFNLTPVWQLDGSRAFRALSLGQRWLVVGTTAAMFAATHEFMLVLVGGVALLRTLTSQRPEREEGDWGALGQFLFLVVILSLMSKMHVVGIV
jgi:Zn-dependent protease